MKLTILDLHPSALPEKDAAITAYRERYQGAEVEILSLADTPIKDCIGCWSCWVKTPGRCVHRDIMPTIYEKLLSSDRVLFLFPTANGFLSGHTKTVIDRLIPLYHPYIEFHAGEMMHYYRYSHYPIFDMWWDSSGLTKAEDQAIECYCLRMNHHFRQYGDTIRVVDGNAILIPQIYGEAPADQPWSSLGAVKSVRRGKIILYNGSPRGKKGNSLILLNEMIKGFEHAGLTSDDYEIRDLIDQKSHDAWAADFHVHSHHLFLFPLYVHAMPSIVMKFFEKLQPAPSSSPQNPQTQMTYIVQSGFPESHQSVFLRAVLAQLPKRLNCLYGGTVIKGGIEGIQIRTEKMNAPLYAQFQRLGKEYIESGIVSPTICKELGKPYKFNFGVKAIFTLLRPTGLPNFFWNMQLKQNNAYEQRFAKPYGK